MRRVPGAWRRQVSVSITVSLAATLHPAPSLPGQASRLMALAAAFIASNMHHIPLCARNKHEIAQEGIEKGSERCRGAPEALLCANRAQSLARLVAHHRMRLGVVQNRGQRLDGSGVLPLAQAERDIVAKQVRFVFQRCGGRRGERSSLIQMPQRVAGLSQMVHAQSHPSALCNVAPQAANKVRRRHVTQQPAWPDIS